MSRLSNDTDVIAEAAVLLTTPLGLPASIAGTAVADATAATAANPAVPGAVTQVAVTDSLDGATFTGTALATSATPTVDELEAIAGMLGLAVNAAGTDIAALRGEVVTYEVAISKLILDVAEIRTKFNALLASLETAGTLAT